MFTIIGTILKILRTEKLMLQKDIDVLLNISKSGYGFYEQGKRTPDYTMPSKIADELDEGDLEYFNSLVERLTSKHSNKLK